MSKLQLNRPQTSLHGENLGQINRCLVCSKEYGSKRLDVIERDDVSKLLYITCQHCQHAMIIQIGMAKTGIMLLGSVTDLSLNDVRFLHAKGKITEDEFLNSINIINNQSRELIKFLTHFHLNFGEQAKSIIK